MTIFAESSNWEGAVTQIVLYLCPVILAWARLEYKEWKAGQARKALATKVATELAEKLGRDREALAAKLAAKVVQDLADKLAKELADKITQEAADKLAKELAVLAAEKIAAATAAKLFKSGGG